MLARREIRRFCGRITLAVFLTGFLDACAVLALALLAAAVTMRMFDMLLPLHWSLGLLAIPALLYAALHTRRARLNAADSTQHLDRLVGLDSLLISGQEVDISAWRRHLDTRLERARVQQPRPRPARLGSRMAVSVAAVAALWLLPDLPHDFSTGNPMVATELARHEEELKLLLEAGAVREEEAAQLQEKLAELKQKHQQNQGRGTWAELDAFGEKLDYQRSRRQDALARARANLKELSGAAPGRVGSQSSFRALAEARGLGLLDKLPKSLADKLDKAFAPPEAGQVGKALDLTPEELELLAKALAEVPALQGVAGLAGEERREFDGDEFRRATEELKKALEGG